MTLWLKLQIWHARRRARLLSRYETATIVASLYQWRVGEFKGGKEIEAP